MRGARATGEPLADDTWQRDTQTRPPASTPFSNSPINCLGGGHGDNCQRHKFNPFFPRSRNNWQAQSRCDAINCRACSFSRVGGIPAEQGVGRTGSSLELSFRLLSSALVSISFLFLSLFLFLFLSPFSFSFSSSFSRRSKALSRATTRLESFRALAWERRARTRASKQASEQGDGRSKSGSEFDWSGQLRPVA